MSSDSDKQLLSLHREAGRWWEAEPGREIAIYLDAQGIRRKKVREIGCIAEETSGDLKVRKVRDEKVSRACGVLPEGVPEVIRPAMDVRACALHAVSGLSFGSSSMLVEEIPPLAASLGYESALIADRYSLAGAHEFHKAAAQVGIKPLIGTSVELPGGGEVVLIARSKHGWLSLSRLLTECHLGEPRLFPRSNWARLEAHRAGLILLTGGATSPLNYLIGQQRFSEANELAERLIALYGRANVVVQIERSYLPFEIRVNAHLLELAERHQLLAVAGGPITHARASHFPVMDVNACVESLCGIDEITERKPREGPGQEIWRWVPRRFLNAERHFRPVDELAAMFADRPDLIENTLRVAERCDAEVLPGRAALPEICPDEPGRLTQLVAEGVRLRKMKLDRGLQRRIDFEMKTIIGLGFSRHFLVAWEMCEWAREQQIHFSARGSVVDSVIAYALGMSRINAHEHHLHFERFLPRDGTKRPDIDIDFEARGREDIRQHLTQKYGKDHVATVAAIGAFSTRGIVREVGKVMGLSPEAIAFLAKKVHGGIAPDRLESALERRPELRDSHIPKERYRWIFRLAERLMDLPRNMRAHSSGVVISQEPVRDFVPVQHSGVECVPILQWDKRSAKRCFDKFDVLCLRGQDVLSETEELIRRKDLGFSVTSLGAEDPEVFAAFRSGRLIGIPQSASPAMRQAHVRLETRDLRDASLVQAGIRPGVGGAVKINELIARRRGKPYTFDHPKLQEILGLTYGIIVFQEQVDQLLQAFVGCSAGEAEEIREAIHKRRREGYSQQIRQQIMTRIVDQGFAQTIAEQVYEYVSGFDGYGFAQGHALSFAEVSIRCVWCQQNHPAEYFAALLNAQPAGYYGPCTIANEARSRGVRILPADVNASLIRFTTEDTISREDPKLVIPNGGVRVGLSSIMNLSKTTQEAIVTAREQGPFESLFDLIIRVFPSRDECEALIRSGSLDSLHPNRRQLLWAIPSAIEHARLIRESSLPLIYSPPALAGGVEDFSHRERCIDDRRWLGLDIEHHLMAFERERVSSKGGMLGSDVAQLEHGRKAFAVGNPIRLRFPPTKSGKRVVFFDLEDESGILNVTCFDATYQRDGRAIICSPYVTVLGEAQNRDGHTAFLAHRVFAYEPDLTRQLSPAIVPRLKTADFLVG